MLGKERQDLIYRKVANEGRVTVSALAREMGVSVETIRRDIKLMDQQHLLQQVHGGAIAVNAQLMLRNLEMTQRKQKHMEERRVIAQRACTYLQPGDVIAINAGLTAEELVKALPGDYGLTVFLTSITALNLLVERVLNRTFDGRVFMLGGFIDTFDMCATGESLSLQIAPFHFDKAFLAPTSFTVDGPMLSSVPEGVNSQTLMQHASKSFCLATSSKFGTPSLYRFCDLNALDVVITGNKYPLPPEIVKALDETPVVLDVCDMG